MQNVLRFAAVVSLLTVIGCEAQNRDPSDGASGERPATIGAADEEFRAAASQKGERALVAAKMLIDFRNNDNWSWERLEGEIDFQFGTIKTEFSQWKQDRISAGDRYK